MALDHPKIDETVDVTTKGPLVDTADSSADLEVRCEHSVPLPWPQEADEGLQGLDMPRLQSEDTPCIAQGSKDRPDVGRRTILMPVALSGAGGPFGNLSEYHAFLNDGHVGP